MNMIEKLKIEKEKQKKIIKLNLKEIQILKEELFEVWKEILDFKLWEAFEI